MLDPSRRDKRMRELQRRLGLTFFGHDAAEVLAEAMDSTPEVDEFVGRNHRNPRNYRLAQLGDAILDYVIVEILFEQGLSRGAIEYNKQKLVNNMTQHRLLMDWGLPRFYFNEKGFLGDPGIDQPASSPDHTPYLEAIIAVVYRCNGMEYTRDWIRRTVHPALVKASRDLD
ncbi:MAG: ribonuclease III domain-containing protein [archaeon]|nr:ribonuclease III domain-containing protein [archaeon]